MNGRWRRGARWTGVWGLLALGLLSLGMVRAVVQVETGAAFAAEAQDSAETRRAFTPPAAGPGLWAPPSTLPAPAAGEPVAVERILAAEGVDRSRPRPHVRQWFRDVGLAVSEALAAWVEGVVGRPVAWVVDTISWALLVGLPVLLAIFLAWRFWRRREPSRPTTRPEPEIEDLAAPRTAPAVWRRRLEEHLAAGRVTEALEALWWWLASTLAGPEADAAWTGRQLLRATGRGDLRAPVRDLEVLAYGRRPVAIGDVEQLWSRLQRTVSGGDP